MIRIVAENHAKPECREAFFEIAKELAVKSRAEEGNLLYQLCEDREDSCHLTFVEEWKDENAIQEHNETEHYKRLVPELGKCTEKNGSCSLYQVII